MKKILALLLCLMLLPAALGESETSEDLDIHLDAGAAGSFAVGVSGDFDAPALRDPEERYEILWDSFDESQQMLFWLMDTQNDEETDIEKNGALYATESISPDDNGVPAVQVRITIQKCPYGKMMISEMYMPGTAEALGRTYTCNTVMLTGEETGQIVAVRQEDFDFYCESYHFPYGPLDTIRGMRQDENGYLYYLIKSDDSMTFEFVTGNNMHIEQLRIYETDKDGVQWLTSYVDYDVGPALEVPQDVLDAIGEALSSTETAAATAESAQKTYSPGWDDVKTGAESPMELTELLDDDFLFTPQQVNCMGAEFLFACLSAADPDNAAEMYETRDAEAIAALLNERLFRVIGWRPVKYRITEGRIIPLTEQERKQVQDWFMQNYELVVDEYGEFFAQRVSEENEGRETMVLHTYTMIDEAGVETAMPEDASHALIYTGVNGRYYWSDFSLFQSIIE